MLVHCYGQQQTGPPGCSLSPPPLTPLLTLANQDRPHRTSGAHLSHRSSNQKRCRLFCLIADGDVLHPLHPRLCVFAAAAAPTAADANSCCSNYLSSLRQTLLLSHSLHIPFPSAFSLPVSLRRRPRLRWPSSQFRTSGAGRVQESLSRASFKASPHFLTVAQTKQTDFDAST